MKKLQLQCGDYNKHKFKHRQPDTYKSILYRKYTNIGKSMSVVKSWGWMLPLRRVAAKLLQLCPTLCNPIDSSPPGFPIPGILQARTMEWVASSFFNAWKWSRSVVSDSSRPHGLQPNRLLHPWDFPGKSTGVGCHCLLHLARLDFYKVFTCWFSVSSWSCLKLLTKIAEAQLRD